MKVSELENGLWFGDVIICCIDTNFFTGEPLENKGYCELVVTRVRNEDHDGPSDPNDENDFDVILMDVDGSTTHIKDIKSLDNWEYSHCAFERGAWITR
jgi:hypothetical protein